MSVDPPFQEFYFVDLDGDKIEHLRALAGDRKDVHLLGGDCNQILLSWVFPKVRWEDYRRGLCLLDPYGLHLQWEVIKAAGELKTHRPLPQLPDHGCQHERPLARSSRRRS